MDKYLSSGQRKTRKPHRCQGCLQSVPTGELCSFYTGISEGIVYTLYYHTECRAAEIDANSDNAPIDDWMPLHELVSNDRAAMMAWLPNSVRERFSESGNDITAGSRGSPGNAEGRMEVEWLAKESNQPKYLGPSMLHLFRHDFQSSYCGMIRRPSIPARSVVVKCGRCEAWFSKLQEQEMTQ